MPEWERSRSVARRLLWRESSASTNAELVALAADPEVPDLTVLATDDQSAGRGRLDRSWLAPPGSALAISVLLRPRLPGGEPMPLERFGWIPLAAGLAMGAALEAVAPGLGARLKWPNDVLVGGRKICGVLAELVPATGAVVVGAGVNTAMRRDQLPVPTATSLAVEGVRVPPGLADDLLAGYVARLRALVAEYAAHGGDAEASGLRELAVAACSTTGREVRIELPGGAEPLRGIATGIDESGRLEVRARGAVVAVAAGDVTHVRPA